MNGISFYETTHPVRLFFLVAIPGGVSMLAASLWGTFEGIFVGQVLGELAFAALNLSFSVIFINFALADLIGVGASVPIAIALGARDYAKANNYFSCACLLIVLVGLLSGAFLFAAAPALVAFLGAEGELARLAETYIRVFALCSPFTTLAFATDNFLRICGWVRFSMWINILLSVLILILQYVCLVLLGLGIGGSAFAVSICLGFCTVLSLVPFLRGKMPLRFQRPRPSLKMLREITSCGTPTFLTNIAQRVTTVFLNMLLLRVGGVDAVNVLGILLYVSDFFQMLLYGVCDALQPALGYNYGARKMRRVVAIAKCCFAASLALAALAMLSMLAIPEALVALFLKSESPTLLALSIPALMLFSLTYLTKWFGFAAQSLLTALGRAKGAASISVAYTLVFPFLWLALVWPPTLDDTWLTFPVSSAATALLAALLLKRLRRELL